MATGINGDPVVMFEASHFANDGKFHLLLAASGSVATIKIPNIVQALSAHQDLSIRLLFTHSASQFLQNQSDEQMGIAKIKQLPNVDGIYWDEDEWLTPWARGAPILHIELRRWADLLVVAPLSANTLAKIAGGLSDNLLTSVIRAWEVQTVVDDTGKGVVTDRNSPLQRAIIVAPAMNTMMWRHPFTARHLSEMHPGGLLSWMQVLQPIEKNLACGDTGDGAMHDWRDIVKVIEGKLMIGSLR